MIMTVVLGIGGHCNLQPCIYLCSVVRLNLFCFWGCQDFNFTDTYPSIGPEKGRLDTRYLPVPREDRVGDNR